MDKAAGNASRRASSCRLPGACAGAAIWLASTRRALTNTQSRHAGQSGQRLRAPGDISVAEHDDDIGDAGTRRIVLAASLRDLVHHSIPLHVILLGSSRRGKATADGDRDLAVILPDDAPPDLPHWQAVNEARCGHKQAVDIVPFRKAGFDATQNKVGSLPWIIAREGRMIREREAALLDE